MKKIEGIIIHKDFCKDTCQEHLSPWAYDYTFQYGYVEQTVKVSACVSGDGIPHSFILNRAEKVILNKLGLKPNRYGTIYSDKSSYLQKERDWNKGNDTVCEICTIGGFNNYFFIEHKISDLNIDEIIENAPINYGDAFWNYIHLLGVIGKMELQKKALKVGHELNRLRIVTKAEDELKNRLDKIPYSKKLPSSIEKELEVMKLLNTSGYKKYAKEVVNLLKDFPSNLVTTWVPGNKNQNFASPEYCNNESKVAEICEGGKQPIIVKVATDNEFKANDFKRTPVVNILKKKGFVYAWGYYFLKIN